MHNAEQLLLDLGHRTALAREDFLVAPCNEDAVAWIDLWPEWPAPAMILHGPAACGKTHLAAVWQARSKAAWIAPAAPGACMAEDAAKTGGNLVIDQADRIIGTLESETELFHLYNIFREEGRSMLVTMRKAPVRQEFVLRDLASRLRAAPAAGILAPDDGLLAAVLVKMFSDRQLKISSEVLEYSLSRIERSFEAARLLVEKVDKAAMRQKRPVTVPLMREVIGGMEMDQEEMADSENGVKFL